MEALHTYLHFKHILIIHFVIIDQCDQSPVGVLYQLVQIECQTNEIFLLFVFPPPCTFPKPPTQWRTSISEK